MASQEMQSASSSAAASASSGNAGPTVSLIAKWGKQRIELPPLPPTTTIGSVKEMLTERTGVLPKRQKLMGLAIKPGGGGGGAGASGRATTAGGPPDGTRLEDLKVKGSGKKSAGVTHQFILMGTPEEQIFVDPHEKDDLPDVIDDFDLDFNAGSDEWLQHVANGENLRKFTDATAVHVMHQPREDKPLLVLDLDHTLLDFSSKVLRRADSAEAGQSHAMAMKRPYMDEFLTSAYRHYDLVVWSQTSWRWLETKLIELGMVTHPGYKFCFVLDKTSMFRITSTKRDGSTLTHHVKPLQLIWTKFPRWGAHNTVHVDDLERNFALNLDNGLKCTAYYRKKSRARTDCELLGLATYLQRLAEEGGDDFANFDFRAWLDVVSGKKSMRDCYSEGGKQGSKK